MEPRVDRIEIKYDLIFSTPFHCGTGIRIGLIDRTVLRDRDGYLYVPASTFKGVLREHCEQLARFYAADEQKRQLITSPHDEEAALRGLGQATTMVTRIFGSQIQPGRLFFEDARQTSNDKVQYDSQEIDGRGKYKSLQVDLFTQVRLDRPTRTAVKGALFTSEFGVRNFSFQGTITGWLECTPIDALAQSSSTAGDIGAEFIGRPTYSCLLLLAGLNMIERLGGNKSTGKGQCLCKIEEVRINKRICPTIRWESWLEHLDMLASYPLS